MRASFLLAILTSVAPASARAESLEPAAPTPEEQVAESRTRLLPLADSVLVHWSAVDVKVRATVRVDDYPAAAVAQKLPDERCVIRLRIDDRGVPYEVVPLTCAGIFVPAAQDIAMRYRFFAHREANRRVKAEFDLAINFEAP